MIISRLINGYNDPKLQKLDQKTILSLSLQAAKDFTKRTSPGYAIIFILLSISGLISNISTDAPFLYYTILSISFICIVLHGFVLMAVSKLSVNTLLRWEVFNSVIIILTAICWGAFSALSLIQYGISNITLVFLLFSTGIASGAAVSAFIWKRITQLYLLILLSPPIFILMTLQDNDIALGLSFGFLVYFIFLFFQVFRSNGEYWTALINTKNLEIQAEALEKANQAKSRFLAIMSHELRTPMNVILGYAQILEHDASLPEDKRIQISSINNAGIHLLELINEILDLSKIEEGHLNLEQIEFDLFKNIDELITILAPSAYSKSLDFEVFIDPAIPRYVVGDSYRVRQILINLLSNAIKFTSEGQVALNVSLDASGQYLFEVHDAGIGISQEIQAEIFKPFVQADDSTTRQFGGTGLGLTISENLVRAMGGSIGVESQPDSGTTFWFKLPLVTVNQSNKEINLNGQRVLLIGENSTEFSFNRYLKYWGAGCDSALGETDARHLIEAAREQKTEYTLIALLEHNESLDIPHLLSSLNLLDSTPVCLLSSNANEKMINHKKSHLDQCIALPVKLTDLIDSVDELFTKNIKNDTSPKNETRDSSINLITFEDKSVLLVEDNIVTQALAEQILSEMGFNVTIANNGLEAVDSVKNNTFDLIFMDVQMPVMNGYKATQKIREIEKLKGERHPILAMTANAMSGDRERCLESGMDDYLSKPVVIEELQKKISFWLSK